MSQAPQVKRLLPVVRISNGMRTTGRQSVDGGRSSGSNVFKKYASAAQPPQSLDGRGHAARHYFAAGTRDLFSRLMGIAMTVGPSVESAFLKASCISSFVDGLAVAQP